jgi:hypothetical protein
MAGLAREPINDPDRRIDRWREMKYGDKSMQQRPLTQKERKGLEEELQEYHEALAGYQGELRQIIFGKEESEKATRLFKKVIHRIQRFS